MSQNPHDDRTPSRMSIKPAPSAFYGATFRGLMTRLRSSFSFTNKRNENKENKSTSKTENRSTGDHLYKQAKEHIARQQISQKARSPIPKDGIAPSELSKTLARIKELHKPQFSEAELEIDEKISSLKKAIFAALPQSPEPNAISNGGIIYNSEQDNGLGNLIFKINKNTPRGEPSDVVSSTRHSSHDNQRYGSFSRSHARDILRKLRR